MVMNKYMENKSLVPYLLFACAVVLIVLGIVGTIWGKVSSAGVIETQEMVPKTLNTTLPLTAEVEEVSEKEVPKDLNDPDQLIEHYRSQLEQNPQDPDTPAYLSAMGNLYKMKKMDCASAIPYYERVIIEYPDWEGIKSIYPELVSCYEEVNDYKGKIWIHEEMMKRFPEDSQEYLFAKESLGL